MLKPLTGVRLVPMNDPDTKLDKEPLVPDEILRTIAAAVSGQSSGYITGARGDGEILGAWQRQQRKVTIHPFSSPTTPEGSHRRRCAHPAR